MNAFDDVTSRALVPEQLAHYVAAVSALRPLRVGRSLGWRLADRLVLCAFPETEPPYGDAAIRAAEDDVAEAARMPGIRHLTVLAPFRPALAPEDADVLEDVCEAVDLPAPEPRGKLASLLRRADRDILVETGGAEAWTAEHDALRDAAAARLRGAPGDRALSDASAGLFGMAGEYLRAGGGRALLHSARLREDGRLVACAVSDHAALATAFYMFAFRARDAPPGSADVLVRSILKEADARGQRRCNLGLGIHGGIRFFKRKWGARPWLPFVETSWRPAASSGGFFSRLFGRGR